jgi:hypothetical protein
MSTGVACCAVPVGEAGGWRFGTLHPEPRPPAEWSSPERLAEKMRLLAEGASFSGSSELRFWEMAAVGEMKPYNKIRTCAKEAQGSNSCAFGKRRNAATHLLQLRRNTQL